MSKRKPVPAVCGAVPTETMGPWPQSCVRKLGHGSHHRNERGEWFYNENRPKKIPTRGFIIKITEWKELHRRISRVCESPGCDPVPDKPDWPAGSTGANIQKLRRLVNQLNARFEGGKHAKL